MSGENKPAAEVKAFLVCDGDGGARLVPGGNIVEGAIEDDGGHQTGSVEVAPSSKG